MTGSRDEEFELSVFLKEQSELFTLLGVFGAISLYLAQFPIEIKSRWLNVGIVSSLLIFIIVALSIRYHLQEEFNSSLFDFIIKPRLESFRVLTFVVPFYLLIFSVLIIAIQFQAAGLFIGQSILMFVGISTTLWVIVTGESLFGYEELGEIGRDKRVVRFGLYMFVVSVLGAILSLTGISHMGDEYGYGFKEIINIQPGPGVVPFVVSYLGGILAGSILYVVLSGLLLWLHWLIHRIDQMEHSEALFQAYRTTFGIEKSADQTELSDFEDE